MRAALFRHVSHQPAAWNAEFERYARIRYSWTLSSEWPRLAMVQTAKVFQDRMKSIAETVPNGQGRLLQLPGLGHVPHLEDPARTYPPLLAFLKEGVR